MIMILGFLVIAGCEPSHQTSQYVGTRGVDFDFSTNMPPDQVYVNDVVYFGFDVFNRGAHGLVGGKQGVLTLDYNPLYFEIEGTQPDIFSLTDQSNRLYTTFNVDGRRTSYTQGEKTVVNLGLLRAQLPGTRESVNTALNANICYPYRTFLSDVVCIDTNVFEDVTDPLCRSTPKTYTGGQGAPISVSRVNPLMMPIRVIEDETETTVSIVDEHGQFWGVESEVVSTRHVVLKPVFEIHIRNVGGGTPFYSDDRTILDACLRSDETRQLNKVYVEADLQGLELDCTPRIVDLKDGITRCEVRDDDLSATSSSYNAVLNVELEYYYVDSQSKSVSIRRLR